MKRYTIEIIIEEGNDEFWEGLIAESKTGCDEIVESIDNSITFGEQTAGMDYEIRLKKFENLE